MPRQSLAIALCRVSTVEQLENNSLNRQRASVLSAAQTLNVSIPDDCWWSGNVSSKRGTNVERKDLQEMIDRCKKDKRIKFVIVDEPDRFMRSIDEAAYFEVTFRQLGVTVWYASDPELNKGDLASKLLKFTKYLSAEGSNEERQHKSIAGQTNALTEGRYPFSPKPGYKRGYERGIQELHPVRGVILKTILIKLASHLVTPTQGLIELNKSAFVNGHSLYKMDKFRKIVTDPFYAGIVEIDKQVKVRNENGLHEAMITKEQHLELLKIMNSKAKNQAGPRKNGNPKYPGNNITICDACISKRNGRFVGFKHSNGHSALTYEKYRCRACRRYLTRQELHTGIEKQFQENPITKEGVEDFIEALNIVWKRREGLAEQEANRIRHKIKGLQESKANQVEAVTDPSNLAIKQEILTAIEKKRDEVEILEDQLEKLQYKAEDDQDRFLRFALNFANNMGNRFLDPFLSQENRLRCKQLVFPAGFYVNKNKKVYTPEKSPLITLLPKKKSTEVLEKSLLVRVRGL